MKNKASIIIPLLCTVMAAAGCRAISTSIEIGAPADAVWREFADFHAYPQWNPFIKKAEGAMAAGNIISIRIQPSGGKAVEFSPRILRIERAKVFEWEGRLFMPGIFTGRHRFEFHEAGKNRTRFVQSEEFSGVLVPFFDLGPTRRGFEKMNAELKKRVERAHRF